MNDRVSTPSQRKIFRRIIVKGTLVLDTPTCLGSGDKDGVTDMMLIRDSLSDRALLAGSSIAGALRNYLRECIQGYWKDDQQEKDRVHLLFGALRKKNEGDQSPLIIYDSISLEAPSIELRDGVKIDSCTGTADEGAKYDFELLRSGTQFPLNFELLIEEQNENQLLQELAIALSGLEKGDIALGIKKRRGFGCCHVRGWQVWNFDLQDTDQRLAWLHFPHWQTGLLSDSPVYPSIEEALERSNLVVDRSCPDHRERFTVQATFKLASPLLIRSGHANTTLAPDVVHLKSYRDNTFKPEASQFCTLAILKGTETLSIALLWVIILDTPFKPVLSGTSLAGVLRHRAERIANTLAVSTPTTIIDDLFGPNPVKNGDTKLKASRLIVYESVIEEVSDLVQTRIAIDRFTGGAYPGALFQEQPVYPGDESEVTIKIEIQNPQNHEIGLFLLLLKDLWVEDLPVGGGSSVGRGRLKGKEAILAFHHPSQGDQWKIMEKDDDQVLTIEGDIKKLQNYLDCLVKKLEEKAHE
jgi:CRISPR/Cas system CSM-associated protein Csm3 (group 7 of RAMP superfamily)